VSPDRNFNTLSSCNHSRSFVSEPDVGRTVQVIAMEPRDVGMEYAFQKAPSAVRKPKTPVIPELAGDNNPAVWLRENGIDGRVEAEALKELPIKRAVRV